jgi:hypothetical protein
MQLNFSTSRPFQRNNPTHLKAALFYLKCHLEGVFRFKRSLCVFTLLIGSKALQSYSQLPGYLGGIHCLKTALEAFLGLWCVFLMTNFAIYHNGHNVYSLCCIMLIFV